MDDREIEHFNIGIVNVFNLLFRNIVVKII